MSFVLLVLLPLAAVAVVAIAVAAVRGRGWVGDDPPGVRSYVAFSDGEEDDPSGDPAEAGEPWAQAIAARLGGMAAAEDYGWSVRVERAGEAFLVRVGLVGDRPEKWLAMVDRARGVIADGPALRALLEQLEEALREAGAVELAWHRRERWVKGVREGSPSPFSA